jgi:hypothetical protein
VTRDQLHRMGDEPMRHAPQAGCQHHSDPGIRGDPVRGMSACLQLFRWKSQRADLGSLHEPGQPDRKGMGRAGQGCRPPATGPTATVVTVVACPVSPGWPRSRPGRSAAPGHVT